MTREQAAIKVDIDSRRLVPVWEITRRLRRAGVRPVAVATAPSPSGTGYHVIVHVSPRPRSPFEVVALAMLLGSDMERESKQLNRARVFGVAPRWMKDAWNVLYAPHPARARRLRLPAEYQLSHIRGSNV